MAEAQGESDKTLTLAEQWLLPEKGQQAVHDEIPVQAAEDEIPVQAAEDEIPVQAAEDEIPIQAAEDENPPGANIEKEMVSEVVVTAKTDEAPAAEESTEAPEEAESEEQEIVEEKPEIKIETAPADFRFPTTNQTRHCFTRYIEYHRCIAAKGEGAPECEKFAKYYRSLCPAEWVERWNEQRENGTFPGPL